MQKETVPRNPWPIPTRSWIPCPSDWKQSRWRSFSTMDVLADDDHIYHLSDKEYFYYRNKWWLHLNKSGSDTLPLTKRLDFKRALSTLQRLQQEAGEEPHVPTAQTIAVGTEFIFYMVELARFLVVFLQFRKSRRRRAKFWVNGETRYL